MGVMKNNSLKKLLIELKNWFSLKAETVFSVNGKLPENGNIVVDEVDRADNLNTEKMLQVDGTAVIRSSGKNASIKDGDAFLLRVEGNRVNNSFDPTCITTAVTGEDIEVSIDRDAFVAAVVNSTTVTFNYITAWSPALADYGLTVLGNPESGNKIVVTYDKQKLGRIYAAKPTAMRSTGWNLYDHTRGYARLCKYSSQSGALFMVGGTYTGLAFSLTLNGARETITPVNGKFSLPSGATEGYVHVSGGNNTNTYIINMWDDWTSGYSGEFKAYEEGVVDFSWPVGQYFANGMFQVGDVRDEIDLNTQMAISRIERKTLSNLTTVMASGRPYEYDMDYVYVVREEPVVTRISDEHYVDGYYVANDHGNEFFDTTPENVAVQFSTLYGSNIKNKLERDVLTISEQTLTEEQKTQVLTNIGAAPSSVSDHISNLSAFENKSIANNLTTSTSGFVLDARQGKTLNDKFSGCWKEGSEAKKITLGSGFWIVVTRFNATVNSMWVIYAYSGNSMGSSNVFNTASITLSMGSNYVLTLSGNISTVRAIYVGS